MLQDCERATRSIDIEEYIFQNDSAGKPLFDCLMRRAMEGIRVRLLIDSAGSFSVAHSPFLEELRVAGIEVSVWNPISFGHAHNLFAWYFRDHRKMLVVDNQFAHTGGVCLQADMRNWRDTQIRIQGPVVEQFARSFNHIWKASQSKKFSRVLPEPPTGEGFQILVNAPRFRQRYIYRELLTRIRRARRRIYITTPYFIPNYRFFHRLKAAVRRGVDVRILTVDKSDHTSVDRASDFHLGPALRAGIKVFRYSPSTLHAKSAVIDDWATVGSTNIDNLSLLLNHEANLTGTDPRFVADMAKIFLDDVERSKEMNLSEWNKRPLAAKLAERLTWPLHRLL